VGAGRVSPHQKKGLRTGAWLIFYDETGLSDRPTVRKTWARKGKTPNVKTAGGWKSRTVMGSIVVTPKGENPGVFAHVHHGSICSPHVIAYIKDLRKHHRRKKKLILIWDGLSAHTSKETQDYLKTQSSWLSVERFPTYAPELNPAEYVWSNIKGAGFANACFATDDELDRTIDSQVKRIARSRKTLRGCLKASGLYC
jgi:transposase